MAKPRTRQVKAGEEPALVQLEQKELRPHAPEQVNAGNQRLVVISSGLVDAVDDRSVKTVVEVNGVSLPVISSDEYNDLCLGQAQRANRIRTAKAVEDQGLQIYATGTLDGVDFIITQNGDDVFSRKAFRLDEDYEPVEVEPEEFLFTTDDEEE